MIIWVLGSEAEVVSGTLVPPLQGLRLLALLKEALHIVVVLAFLLAVVQLLSTLLLVETLQLGSHTRLLHADLEGMLLLNLSLVAAIGVSTLDQIYGVLVVLASQTELPA